MLKKSVDFLVEKQDIFLSVLGTIAVLYITLKIIDTIKRFNYLKLDKEDMPSNEECYWRHGFKKTNGIISYKCTKPFLIQRLRPKRCQSKCKFFFLKDAPVYKTSRIYYVFDMICGFLLSVAMIAITIIVNVIK